MTKKPAAPKKRVVDSDDEGDSDVNMPSDDNINDDDDDRILNDTPPQKKVKKAPLPKKAAGKPLGEIENDSFAVDADMDGVAEPKPKKTKAGGNTDKYQKVRSESAKNASAATRNTPG